jgi:ribonuclease P/MRP protein subunit POP5
MSPLPPTLRAGRRYVLVRIDPSGTCPDPKELYHAVSDAVSSLWGDARAAEIQPSVVLAGGGRAIVRCVRGTERDLCTALATVTACSGVRIALRTVVTSGTIKKLKREISSAPREAADFCGNVLLNGKEYTVARSGDKADLREKGFKNTELLFFTEEDLENLKENPNAATIPDGI